MKSNSTWNRNRKCFRIIPKNVQHYEKKETEELLNNVEENLSGKIYLVPRGILIL